VIGCLLLLVILLVSKKSPLPKADKKTIAVLIISGGLIGFNWIFLFESYNYTTVATATLCYYLEPSIVMLLSPIFFAEKLTPKKIFYIAASFIGMVLVSGIIGSGLPSVNELKGILYGIAAAAIYSSVVIINKKLPKLEPFSKTFIQLAGAAVVILPYVLISEDITAVPTDPRSIVLILILGAVHTGIAYALYFGSINGLRTQTDAIFSYVDPVTALFLSFFFLNEKVTVYGLIGAFLMIGSAVLSVTGEQKKK
jgi:RarD protein